MEFQGPVKPGGFCTALLLTLLWPPGRRIKPRINPRAGGLPGGQGGLELRIRESPVALTLNRPGVTCRMNRAAVSQRPFTIDLA